jgi:predicted hotdog family 3-hydroxylacyl-ACP dehydratase
VIGPIDIRSLVPHCGAMVLLDAVERWDAIEAVCAACSHLDPDNPLRRAGRLGAACGIEYGMQAAAVHGALLGGGVAPPPGRLAALRAVAWHVERLDDPGFGALRVTARLEGHDAGGLAYAFRVAAADGLCLVEGRGLVALPR